MDQREELWKDYESILASFRQLAEIRFKLLALLPTISGLAIGVVSYDLQTFKEAPLPRLLIGMLGVTVTLGIVFYDQRNSQLYNALSHRAKELEKQIGATQFSNRPGRSLCFLGVFKIWHDRGLALIYGAVIGAWLFPILCGLLWVWNRQQPLLCVWNQRHLRLDVPTVSAIIAVGAALVMIYELQRLDRRASRVENRCNDRERTSA